MPETPQQGVGFIESTDRPVPSQRNVRRGESQQNAVHFLAVKSPRDHNPDLDSFFGLTAAHLEAPTLLFDAAGTAARIALENLGTLLLAAPFERGRYSWETVETMRAHADQAPLGVFMLIGEDSSQDEIDALLRRQESTPEGEPRFRLLVCASPYWAQKAQLKERVLSAAQRCQAMPMLLATPEQEQDHIAGAALAGAILLPMLRRALACVDWSDIALIFRNRPGAYAVAAAINERTFSEGDLVQRLGFRLNLFRSLTESRGFLLTRVTNFDQDAMERHEELSSAAYLLPSDNADCLVMHSFLLPEEVELGGVPYGAYAYAVFSGPDT